MSELMHVGVDLGGTTTKMALIDESGKMIDKWAIATNTIDNGSHIASDIGASIVRKLGQLQIDRSEISGIGMGAPGFIDMATGFVYKAVNIGWENYPLKDELEKLTGMPAIIENDANLAALGEMWLGAGQGARNIVCITLGTGVGGGIICDGEILHGVSGMAGEIGHITVLPKNGAPCNCGKSGCLETVSSATGIRRLALEALDYNDSDSILRDIFEDKGDISAEDVFDCAEKKDPLSLVVAEKAAYYLGYTLGAISMVVNPEKIIIGGGVSHAGNTLLLPLTKYFKKFSLPRAFESCTIDVARLGNDAGVIGGAWLAKTKIGRIRTV
ncbi:MULTISPECIES: ROK family glucokinase [unclassified Sporolactobacillus]|uniref:ROK family glucokinase n=1 Tax=unclassified Sporolactobacillus TaxID=2628533 RepID=UPI0023676BA3|nr:ROK family glucokinase [Sporolactobacillus sp. CQH2019]MDD9150774.1 ROK family glucokinase [Sporolactobacillus sp. CQH2019]